MQDKTTNDRTDIGPSDAHEPGEIVVPVVAEELNAETERVRTGSVRVRKTVQQHEEIIDQPLVEEKAEIRRVVKNEVVEGPLPVRQAGDTTIIPVVKEVLVVQKQYVLTEEVHIRTVRTEQRHEERVVVKEEQAEVQRLDSRGRVVETEGPPAANLENQHIVAKPSVHEEPELFRRKSILRDDASPTASPADTDLAKPAPRRRKKLLE